MLTFNTPKHHWNYYLALEKDLENVSRYIEFANENLATYSIELTHILLSASSEVDVIMKQICQLLEPGCVVKNINDYKSVMVPRLPVLLEEVVTIDRFGISFRPWENWQGENNPDWWRSHNNVKHQRDVHFAQANLQNTINAVGALLITVTHYYHLAFSKEIGHEIGIKDATRQLQPEPMFLRVNADYYHHYLIG